MNNSFYGSAMELILREIIEGVANTYGAEFFNVIIHQLDKAIQSDYTFIGRLDKINHLCETVALVAHGKLIDNFEYGLEGTPCSNVADDSICFYPDKITELFPDDQLLIDMKVKGYIGTPLHDSKGEVMGLIVALYEKPIKDKDLTLTLFQLFSGRISGEFERIDREKELIELNRTLDDKVKARTAELELTINKLQRAQEHLVEIEKMAVLGDLVAGVAHEVNGPLGVAITAESHLAEEFESFNVKLTAEKLSMHDMKHFVGQYQKCLPMISHNLRRAKEIIDNFKLMATEQSGFNSERICLNQYYQRLITTLAPLLKRRQAQVNFAGCQQDYLMTYPGCHAQILTNLVNNSIQHGFLERGDNIITIKISHHNDFYTVDFYDNGVGITKENQARIFEPFYTTTRSKGNIGLGLSIAYNLVVTSLNGNFISYPCEKGVHFQYRFKSFE